MVNFPYIVYGTITDSEASNPDNAKVILRNDRTGEKTSGNTNSSGVYLLDAANLTNGYVDSDRFTVICAYGDEDNEESFLMSSYPGGHMVNLTLATVAESSDTTYCQIQDVLDELGDKTTSDIAYERVRKIIIRAESEIDERSGTTFKSTLISKEILNFDQYTSWKSAEQLRGYQSDMIVGTRNDYWNTYFNDKIRVKNAPLINPFTQLSAVTTTVATTLTVDSTSGFPSSGTIFIYNSTNGTERIDYTGTTSTTFTGCTRSADSTTATAHADDSYVSMNSVSKNTGGSSGEDNWEDLEPQLGGGGSYIINTNTGIVIFVNNPPPLGIRKMRVSYSHGYDSVPKTIERLSILLSVRDVLTSKSSDEEFDKIDDMSLDGISTSGGVGGSVNYFRFLNEEIERLWKIVGDLRPLAV